MGRGSCGPRLIFLWDDSHEPDGRLDQDGQANQRAHQDRFRLHCRSVTKSSRRPTEVRAYVNNQEATSPRDEKRQPGLTRLCCWRTADDPPNDGGEAVHR